MRRILMLTAVLLVAWMVMADSASAGWRNRRGGCCSYGGCGSCCSTCNWGCNTCGTMTSCDSCGSCGSSCQATPCGSSCNSCMSSNWSGDASYSYAPMDSSYTTVSQPMAPQEAHVRRPRRCPSHRNRRSSRSEEPLYRGLSPLRCDTRRGSRGGAATASTSSVSGNVPAARRRRS